MRDLSFDKVWSGYQDNKPNKPVDLESLLFSNKDYIQKERTNNQYGKPIVISNFVYQQVKDYCDKNQVNFNEVCEAALVKWIQR